MKTDRLSSDRLPGLLTVCPINWPFAWITRRLPDSLTVSLNNWPSDCLNICDCMTVGCLKTWLTYCLVQGLTNCMPPAGVQDHRNSETECMSTWTTDVYLNNWRLPENWPSVWWPSAWLNDYLPEYLAVYLTHWQSVWITDRLSDRLTAWIYDCMADGCLNTWLTYCLVQGLTNCMMYAACRIARSQSPRFCREIILAKPALFLFILCRNASCD